jgi:Tol biopolymer transport system component
MSPEQAEGKPLDPRSDIFSFGALLYEMTTGQRAFRGETSMSTISAILRDDPVPAGQLSPDVPRDLDKIIARCMRKDPERRFQTMADVRVALLELKEESESGRLPAPAVTPVRKANRGWGFASGAAILLAAAVFFGLRTRQVAPVRDAEPLVTPFTSFAGFQGQPTFSPDGNQIAFAWTGGEGSQAHIYAKMIGTETQLQLTSGDDAYPSWSPDGRSIAFLRRSPEGVGVYQVPPLGGTVHRVAQLLGASRVRWTRDAKFLLVGGRQTAADKPGIFVISAETGQMRALKLGEGPGFTAPALSPDNKTLAFSRAYPEQGSDLMVADLNDRLEIRGEQRRLKADQGSNAPWDWTADGKEVIYVSGYPGVSARLMRIAADGSGAPHAVVGANDGVFAAAMSPRSDSLVYARGFSDVNVWIVPLIGPGKSGTPTAFLSSTRADLSRPNAFSPDGRRLAFESDRSGKRTIWVANRDGSQATPLIAGDAFTTGSPAWSPDGKWIAFDTRRDGNPEVYVVSSDGGPVRRITNHPSMDAVPSWSHDGKWIYFSSDRTGHFEIFKVPAEGGDPVQVTRAGGWSTQESPDGKYLYYSRLRGPGAGALIAVPVSPLLRMPVEGGPETQLIDGVRERCWVTTQEGIWYIWADKPERSELRFLDFKTGKTSMLNTLTKPLGIGLAISPDGRELLFNQVDQQGSEILLVENFR